jgi:uncharacterized protein (TIGR03437 family)
LQSRLFLFFLCAAAPLAGQGLNPKPVKALGAPRLIATQASPLAVDSSNPNYVEGRELFSPFAVALDNSVSPPAVYVADTGNNRILGWRSGTQLTAGAPADVVLGQKSLYTTAAGGPGGALAGGLSSPTGIVVDGFGNVYVADSGNNRVLRFPQPFLQPLGASAPDLVLGQSTFLSNTANATGVTASSLSLAPTGNAALTLAGLTFDYSGYLYVSDTGNNRVLRFPPAVLSPGTNGASADLVIGQPSYTSNTAAANAGARATVTRPNGLAVDQAGRLYVADSLGRILVFQPPFVLGSTALRLVGIVPTPANGLPPPRVSQTGIGFVEGITLIGNRLVAVDTGANRALVYDPFTTWPDETVSFSPPAQYVIGQGGYSLSAANRGLGQPGPSTLSVPLGAAASSAELYIADSSNNRVVVIPITAGIPSGTASRVIGQLGLVTGAANLIEGREFELSSQGLTGSMVFDRSSNPPHLYVADTGNNRVLGFKDAIHVQAGDIADLVIGQPDFYRSVVNYPAGDAAKPTASSLNLPTGLALDAAGNLYVSDAGNGRVLRFPQPFGQKSSGMLAADLVIGQANFTAQATDINAQIMRRPFGVALTTDGSDAAGNATGSLLVSDVSLNRVLYFPKPFVNGMAATKVIGQSDFSSGDPNGSRPSAGGDPARFIQPRLIATDSQDRVYVCDTGSGRVAIFGPASTLPATLAPPAFSLANNLSQPTGLAIGPDNSSTSGGIWVADANSNRLIHFAPYSQLAQNPIFDAAQAAIGPLAAAFDPYGNLATADSANRILFYVPMLAVTNAANFLTRAVSAGSAISLFPSPAANLFGPGTASFDSVPNPIPLPTTLADVQVLVNQQPQALFYASPGQINLPLSYNLPPSGTVDLRVVRKSTGQVYADVELPLAPVSPGLFTFASTGTGQAAALNQDGTVNSANNPLTRGSVIQLFGTGQGPVANPPADGTPSTALNPTALPIQVQIGGITIDPGNVLYSGLAPGLVAVWQINVLIPAEVTAGPAIPVIISVNSVPTLETSSATPTRITIALQ